MENEVVFAFLRTSQSFEIAFIFNPMGPYALNGALGPFFIWRDHE